MIIRTVSGDIAPGDLGHTQCHEHLFIEMGPSFNVSPVLLMEGIEEVTNELNTYRQAGGVSVIDAQPAFCGRMAERLVQAESGSGVHIIASTGFHKSVFYPDCPVLHWSGDQIADFFSREIEIGMISSRTAGYREITARAGLIKVALDSAGPTSNASSQKLLEAAMTAALRTGSAILCHTDNEIIPIDHVNFIVKHGIAPNRMILSHLDRTMFDLYRIKDLMATGVYITCDTIARPKYHSDDAELTFIDNLIQAGYVDRIMLALDTTRQRLRCYGGTCGLDYIRVNFINQMRKAGFDEIDIVKMTKTNAARVLPLDTRRRQNISK
ncbi:MAG: hypothetical protein Q4G68_00210 [Planctomycetia bacterium]|nr:hypothetical protein [Planctomycetia bacterium]